MTQTHRYEVTVLCAEGDVTCDRVALKITDNKTGASRALMGRTLHTLCKDGQTPCRFEGYWFVDGSTQFLIQEEGGMRVFQGKSEAKTQAGHWQR